LQQHQHHDGNLTGDYAMKAVANAFDTRYTKNRDG